MKIVLFGAGGTIGRHVHSRLKKAGHEVLAVGLTSGDLRADFRDRASLRALFERTGPVDAVASAAGDVVFKDFTALEPVDWASSFDSKLLGQIQLVRETIPHLNDGGSITLMTGVLSRDYVRGGVIATTVGRAIEGFAQALALELPRGLRINVVSPTVIEDSLPHYGSTFAGFEATTGAAIARAYEKAIFGVRTGQIIEVG